MRLLLDTHSFLWFITLNEKLPQRNLKIIRDEANDISVSIASLWEMAIKSSIGKLELPHSIPEIATRESIKNRIEIGGIKSQYLHCLQSLPFHHRDPFDRLIIAQALTDNLPVLSVDDQFDAYGVTRIW